MTQVCQELAGDGNLDVWEVDRIVGAYRLPNGSCRYAVVWAAEEEGEAVGLLQKTWACKNHALAQKQTMMQFGTSILVQAFRHCC